MQTTIVQRWRDRRGVYRLAGEPIRTKDYEVTAIAKDSEVKAFVEQHHYEHSYVAARLRVGLYRRDQLVGVAVFSNAPSEAAAAKMFTVGSSGIVLGRLVLLDEVPGNGESWFVARAFEIARQRFDVVAADSDPGKRVDVTGREVFGGHLGIVYQALNAVYVGTTKRRTRRLFPDGTVFSDRAWSKLRLRERGWRYVVDLLVRHGAPSPSGEWARWVHDAVNAVTRTVRHPGNHRYLWALDRNLRRHLPTSLPYPKWSM